MNEEVSASEAYPLSPLERRWEGRGGGERSRKSSMISRSRKYETTIILTYTQIYIHRRALLIYVPARCSLVPGVHLHQADFRNCIGVTGYLARAIAIPRSRIIIIIIPPHHHPASSPRIIPPHHHPASLVYLYIHI